jgi:hypothetical protein
VKKGSAIETQLTRCFTANTVTKTFKSAKSNSITAKKELSDEKKEKEEDAFDSFVTAVKRCKKVQKWFHSCCT